MHICLVINLAATDAFGVKLIVLSILLSAVALSVEPDGHHSYTSWTAKDGRVIQAAFLAVIRFEPKDPDRNVLVIEKNGQVFSIPFNRIDNKSKEKARRIKDEAFRAYLNAREEKEKAEWANEDIAQLKAKMDRIIFDRLHFVGASLEEAIEFLRVKSRDLDTEETDPNKKGVNIINLDENNILIHLDVTHCSLSDALRYVAEFTGATYTLDRDAVRVSADQNHSPLILIPRVQPDFFSFASNAANTGELENPDPFDEIAGADEGASSPRKTVMYHLSEAGIAFGKGAFAVYDNKNSSLWMRNTSENCEKLKSLLDRYTRGEK